MGEAMRHTGLSSPTSTWSRFQAGLSPAPSKLTTSLVSWPRSAPSISNTSFCKRGSGGREGRSSRCVLP